MEKDFDTWNKLKKKIDEVQIKPNLFPKQGEVWMCVLGKNVGREQNGGDQGFSRPVLVIKKFNNEIYWIIPLSSKQKPYDFYYNFCDISGMRISAVIAQLRLVSIKRFKRLLYELSQKDFIEICDKARNFIP